MLSQCDADSEVNYYLGHIYANQEYEGFDPMLAHDYFMDSEEEALFEEANELGKIIYSSDDYDEPNVAFDCFMKSASMGNDRAMCNVAMCYLDGYGVEQDFESAAKYYKQAADLGNVKAMYRYGDMCLNADYGMSNAIEGIDYITRAAYKGYADAQYSLGTCYNEGYAVSVDKVSARMWLERAVQNGSEEAQDYLDKNF
ncbi:MAG: sel1 repeat family protein [Clostridiales bacterium]|nr:sel1 repeat family protein [Clostridiales bacterium]